MVGMEVLTESLVLSGIDMAIVNETTPLCGCEYVESRVFDTSAEYYGHGLVLHGSQISATLVLSSVTWDIFLKQFGASARSKLYLVTDQEAYTRIKEPFEETGPSGRMAEEYLRYTHRAGRTRRHSCVRGNS